MSSHKVDRARKVFQNLGSPSGEATRLAHVAEQAWSLCIRMNTGKLEDIPINMSLALSVLVVSSLALVWSC